MSDMGWTKEDLEGMDEKHALTRKGRETVALSLRTYRRIANREANRERVEAGYGSRQCLWPANEKDLDALAELLGATGAVPLVQWIEANAPRFAKEALALGCPREVLSTCRFVAWAKAVLYGGGEPGAASLPKDFDGEDNPYEPALTPEGVIEALNYAVLVSKVDLRVGSGPADFLPAASTS
jgi:hypothetical protein